MDKLPVDMTDMLLIIGQKEVEIYALRKEIERLKQELSLPPRKS